MNKHTGELKVISPGEESLPTTEFLEVSAGEERVLRDIEPKHRPYTLGWLRYFVGRYGKEKVPPLFRRKLEEAYAGGWNAAIYFKADSFFVPDYKIKKVESPNEN